MLSSLSRQQLSLHHHRVAGVLLARTKATAAAASSPAAADDFPRLKTSAKAALKHIPGPSTYPFIDAFPTFSKREGFKKREEYFRYLYDEYGWVSKLEVFGTSRALLFHPDDMRALYAADGKYPSSPVEAFPALIKHLERRDRKKNNFSVLEGQSWRTIRSEVQKYILPPKEAHSYLPWVNEVTRDFVKMLPHHPKGDKFVPRYTCELIGIVLFGRRLGE